MSVTITPTDLSTYLGEESAPLDNDRAQMLISHAVTQALAIVTVGAVPASGPTSDNLPNGAESVILAAVSRIFLNPAGVTQETTGPFSYQRTAASGSMFSKAERQVLRRLAGRSPGAFSIDPTPDSVLSGYIDPLTQPTTEDTLEFMEEEGYMGGADE